MDQEPTMWIKKEGTDEVQTELRFMGQVFPISMNVKEELEEGAKEESVRDPMGISWSTDFIKEDPELNLEMNVTENIHLVPARIIFHLRIPSTSLMGCILSYEKMLVFSSFRVGVTTIL
ncbi:uncharacterized protein LOC126427086 isoform X6 [Schistocerca serialis cubense]|uniref:uncharacterized protein LOC126427086 isoform X6 n=1 Tax=Schistocerca serialis cubense TaxID=2023355 RepID=UPI00214EC4DE|nr:uncharacterized protein LOC126427086 isoform X6 [Schistocerca serialis cubense]